MGDQAEFLKSVPHFSGMEPAELESIGEFVFHRSYDRGEMILLEDEPVEALYFVNSGVVKVLKTSPDGKEQILYLVRPGESLNDVPAFDGGPSPIGAQAMSPVALYGVNYNDLQGLLREYPRLAVNATRVLSERVRSLMSLVEDLSFRHVLGRVAKVLLENLGDGTGGGPRLTQQDMAAMAGTAREMVGRSLRVLEDEGTIRLDRHRIVINDRGALRELAGVEG